jgi:hypothetical protein
MAIGISANLNIGSNNVLEAACRGEARRNKSVNLMAWRKSAYQ